MKNRLIIAMLFSLTISCQQTNQRASEESKTIPPVKKTITWLGHYHKSDQKFRAQLVKEVKREFQFLHQDIEVIDKYWQDGNNQYLKSSDLIVDMINKNKFDFDIALVWHGNYSEIGKKLNDAEWGKKHLVDFSDSAWFINAHREFLITNGNLSKQYNGLLTGPANEASFANLFVNTKLAKRMDIHVKTQNITMQDIHDIISKVNAYNIKNKTQIKAFDFDNGYSSFTDFSKFLILSAYLEEASAPGNKQATLQALKRTTIEMESLHKLLGTKTMPFWQDVKEMAIYNDKALLAIYPSYVYEFIRTLNAEKAENLIPAELPMFNKSPQYYPGFYQQIWCVMKNSPRRNEAIKLIKYICSNSFAERWISYSKTPTGLNTRINSSKFSQDAFEKHHVYLENKYGANIQTFNTLEIMLGKNSLKEDGEIINILKSTFEGALSANEAYRRIQTFLN